ncbi:DUF1749-domain-containing protein [Setomelanomma holmii]|uniref:DUF1749-domain-containing protein n=1 Tax=Setomelanomma holmii TaxID=210430 RepID=A0A9P4H154_9PLEO|nr:DUF1749-domain-containing protein [Setomelanomma holmii]
MSAKPFPKIVCLFNSPTPNFCAYERGDPSSTLEPLFAALQSSCERSYSFWEFRIRSSYTGFGYSSIANDAEDISAMVGYLRGLGKEKIVLLGSSTYCQDILAYASSTTALPEVDAYIHQAPTSDRETASLLMPPTFLAQTLGHAEDMIARGNKDEIMPKSLIPPIFTLPITAYRGHSLIAKGGDDDYFSENDEMVPASIDKERLLRRWKSAAPKGVVSDFSGLIPGADHALREDAAQEWFAARVVEFLRTLGV